jgi:energy-coupling factor transporter ATP-binding protein EcfA2
MVPMADDDPWEIVKEANGPTIVRVLVKNLFGRYSYDIRPRMPLFSGDGTERLVILYGENGSGKTTILSLVFDLLSPAHDKAHRSHIGSTMFTEFSVELSNGVTVSAFREGYQIDGDYYFTIYRNVEEPIVTLPMIIDREGKLDSKDEIHLQLETELKKLDISPFYLPDSRSLLSDTLSPEDHYLYLGSDGESKMMNDYLRRRSRRWRAPEDMYEDPPRQARQGIETLLAIRRFDGWLSRQVIRGQRQGFASSNTVLISVLESLLRSEDPEYSGVDGQVGSIKEQIAELDHRIKEYERFGLVQHFPARQFMALLEQAQEEQVVRLERALAPHLKSSRAQLDKLESLYNLLFTFTKSMNTYLRGKEVVIRPGRGGIDLITDEPEPRPLGALELSSGEQQLLLLLCNIIVARNRSKLFIIDEPEISLNVTWQRKLLDTLLDLTAGTGMQFIVATHSIEMLTTHDDAVIKLDMLHA